MEDNEEGNIENGEGEEEIIEPPTKDKVEEALKKQN
jgi:hypothetical protein